MNAEERMTKGQLDIDEEWRKINEGQNCYHY